MSNPTVPQIYPPGLGSLVLQWILVLLHVVGVLIRSAMVSPVSGPVVPGLPVPMLLLLLVVPVVVLLVSVVGLPRVRPGSTPVVHVGQTPGVQEEKQPLVVSPSTSGFSQRQRDAVKGQRRAAATSLQRA